MTQALPCTLDEETRETSASTKAQNSIDRGHMIPAQVPATHNVTHVAKSATDRLTVQIDSSKTYLSSTNQLTEDEATTTKGFLDVIIIAQGLLNVEH